MPHDTPHLIHRRRSAGLRGSVMTEFALIATLFFALLVGIADFGQFLFVQQAIIERARAAARWGAANGPANTTAIQNMVLYAQSAPTSGAMPSFGLTASMVNVSTPDAGTVNYRLVVQVSGYSYQVLSPYLAGLHTGQPVTVSFPLGLYN
jgi:Flp pilus assembly protein TadG